MAGMHQLANAAEAIGATTKKNEKVAILADYFCARSIPEAAVAAVFFSGRAFPAWEETTMQVGGALLWQALKETTGKTDAALTAAYRQHGDLGNAAHDLLLAVAPPLSRPGLARQGGGVPGSSAENLLNVLEVERAFRQIAAVRGPAAKATLLRELLEKATPLQAKYLVKIMTGELRIGLKESLVEEAIAKAYGAPVADVQRANMLLGDIGETLRLAATLRLAEARMRLFHPLGFMLASPVESVAEAFEFFTEAAVEDKYDGIRAQAHISRQSSVVRKNRCGYSPGRLMTSPIRFRNWLARWRISAGP